MEDFMERSEKMKEVARKIQESGLKFPDIRERDWRNIDAPAAKIMNLLVETEDILMELDEIQMNNNQCFPQIEDFMLQIGEIRSKYSDFVDNNSDILDVKIK